MLICLFGITPERALQVWYSIPYASEAATLVAPGSRNVKIDRRSQGPQGRRAARRHAGPDPDAARRTTRGINLQRFDDEATGCRR